MRIRSFRIALLLPAVALMQLAAAAEFEVVQLDHRFSVTALKIAVGDTVSFRNRDHFAHNIFSLSDAKPFDLGSFGFGETRKVTFDKPGVVEVECALHPDMHLTIRVQAARPAR